MQIRSIPARSEDHLDSCAKAPRPTTAKQEWRCSRCGKLLGMVREGRLHLRFARGHEYLVGFPATSVCRSCRTLNELRNSTALSSPPTATVLTRR